MTSPVLFDYAVLFERQFYWPGRSREMNEATFIYAQVSDRQKYNGDR